MADQPARRDKPLTRLTVLRTGWLTPHLVRVVAGGPGLADFVANEFTDQYVKVVFPRPGVTYPEPFDLRTIREQLPREQWPALRAYTVRYHRPDGDHREPGAQPDQTRESEPCLTIDVLYHGDEGLAGPWVAGLKPGDEVIVRGPGGAYAPDADADWHLLVGDEAALPAIAASLERIPAGRPVWAFIEVDGAAEELPLASTGKATISWLHRGVDVSLPDAVRALDFPPGRMQAFVHGEAGMVKQLRSYLLSEVGVPREDLSISGYWRRGMNDEAWRILKKAEKAEDAAR